MLSSSHDKSRVSVDYLSGIALQLKILMDNCIQLWCQTSGGPLRLGKKARTLDIYVHFVAFLTTFIH